MSASLVGSEMCIRDRRFPSDDGVAEAAPQLPVLLGRTRTGVAPTAYGSCLLYTSDAADDM
eukprot:11597386-Alexandrium_andersonii.AAC.1